MDAGKLTITKIFDRTEKLEIPFFQRSYVWREEQWERFYSDMMYVTNNERPYFLGSIILKATPSRKGEPLKRTVIDGQQRLTTVSIFFKVYCLKTKNNDKFDNLFRLFKDQSFPIIHNAIDSESFDHIMNITSIDEINHDNDTKQTLKKNNGIVNCYKYFVNQLDVDMIDLDVLLSNILFVGIDLSMEEDEQQIFDTINSLGVNLTTAELLKNFFFGKEQFQDYVNYWKEIFENDENDKEYWEKTLYLGRFQRSIIDIFFYALLQIKVQEYKVSTTDKVDFSRVDKLFTSYKRFITEYMNDNKTEILKQIKEYAQIFKDNIRIHVIDQTLQSQSGIDRMNAIIFGLDTSTLLPYILYITKNQSNQTLRDELFHTIETYVLRRIITRANNKAYNRLFGQTLILNEVLDKDAFINALANNEDSSFGIPSDEDVLYGFHNSKLDNKTARGVLYLLESKLRISEKHDLLLKGMNDYTLEHIMPKKWRNKWESCENPLERDKLLLTIGNLAVINGNLNTSIKDGNWTTKKTGNNKDKGLLEYSSGLITLRKYLEEESWNENNIKERANDLYKSFIDSYGSYSEGVGSFEVENVPNKTAKKDKVLNIIGLMKDYATNNDNIMFDPSNSSNTYVRFTTRIMDNLFPINEESYKTGFKNSHQLMYEIVLSTNKNVYIAGTISQGAGKYNKESVDKFVNIINKNKMTHRRKIKNSGGWLWFNRWETKEVFNVETEQENSTKIWNEIKHIIENKIFDYEKELFRLYTQDVSQ